MLDCVICASHADGLPVYCETVIKRLEERGHVGLEWINGFYNTPFSSLGWEQGVPILFFVY